MLTEREKFIAVLSNDIISPADVIILLEGDGCNRIHKAAELYRQRLAPKVLFSGGADNHEYGSFPIRDLMQHITKEGISREDLIIDELSKHTQGQAVEFVKMATKKNWGRAILVASPDHQYRAYLTFLRQILDTAPDIILMNSPASNLEWNIDCGWGKPIDRIEQEFEKIDKYSSFGHLASFEEALNYQVWKEQQLKRQD